MTTRSEHQPARRIRNRLTRLGLHFAFVAGFALLGGAIRNLNLLLVLAGLMVAALLMQWRWCKRSTEALTVRRRLPTEAFAGTPFRVRFQLTNHHRLLPVWMLAIEDRLTRRRDRAEGGWIGQIAASAIKSVADSKPDAVARTGVGVLAGRQTRSPGYTCQIQQRGCYELGPIEMATSFPFSLMKSQVIVADTQALDVYPRLLKLRRGWQRRLLSRTGGASVNANRSGPDDGEFFGLREYQPGDQPKWIHWRTSARIGELAVRQFEQERRFDACVLLDAYADRDKDGRDHDASESDASTTETAISLAATLLVELSSTPGNRVVLAIAGRRSEAIRGGASYVARQRMFRQLARLSPSATPSLAQALVAAIEAAGVAQDLVVVSCRSRTAAEQADSSLRSTLRNWGRGGRVRWLDVNSTATRRWWVSDPDDDLPAKLIGAT